MAQAGGAGRPTIRRLRRARNRGGEADLLRSVGTCDMPRSRRQGTMLPFYGFPTVRRLASAETEVPMLYWAVVFLVIAIIAALFGFGGIASASAGIAKILFFIFLILLIVSLVMHFARGRGSPPPV
jgi:uncharacterized membrane protein YtjA (UPF0391 family)